MTARKMTSKYGPGEKQNKACTQWHFLSCTLMIGIYLLQETIYFCQWSKENFTDVDIINRKVKRSKISVSTRA